MMTIVKKYFWLLLMMVLPLFECIAGYDSYTISLNNTSYSDHRVMGGSNVSEELKSYYINVADGYTVEVSVNCKSKNLVNCGNGSLYGEVNGSRVSNFFDKTHKFTSSGQIKIYTTASNPDISWREPIYWTHPTLGPIISHWVDHYYSTYYYEVHYSISAKYIASTYSVKFNANGGSGSMSSQTFSNGTSQALKANTFTRSGYEFIGWATSSSGSVVYSDQQSISLSANKTLCAVWKVIDGAFDLVFGNLASKNWKQGFFLNNTSNDVSVMHSFLLGETIYRNFFFANTGNEILKDEFSVLHEVLNSDGTVRHSYTQFSNYEYAQNYGRYWANNPWESGLGNLPVGSYIYRCTIDSENVIPESNESNNIFEYSFSIIDASHEDSLLEALGIGKFAVTVGGDAEWFAQKDVTHDGVSAVQSGDISDNQTSWMEVVVKNVSSVSFWWKVSSESGCDKLHFYVDGTEVVEPISGESDWIKVEHALTTDSHTLKWVYTKDGSVSNGDDCG
ncbi:MAG: InlB B-repeat-containing protein, partial [Kiritimatiellae bacterium]|nr:InlB B-repeat-containing protein [Kiritimatiellia bacterium]